MKENEKTKSTFRQDLIIEFNTKNTCRDEMQRVFNILNTIISRKKLICGRDKSENYAHYKYTMALT